MPRGLVTALDMVGVPGPIKVFGALVAWGLLFFSVLVRRTALALVMALFAPLALYYQALAIFVIAGCGLFAACP